MTWIPGLSTHRRARRPISIPSVVEVLEARMLLADGIAAQPGPQITGSPGVPVTNAVVASFTVTDPSGSPGTKWDAHIKWGDGTPDAKMVAATAGPNGTFQVLGTHTYTAAGTYTITVMIAVPGSHKPNDNVVMTPVVIQSSATLTSIAVTPANPNISPGATQQFTATGTFSDSTIRDLAGQVTWASANPAVATITAAGLATGVAPGTSSISAKLGGVTGSTVLTVSPSQLVSIAITPVNPTIARGAVQQFTAIGTFANKTTQDLTGQVTWTSTNPAVATISAKGLATAVAAGSSAISAKLNGVTGTTTLTVKGATLLAIAVTPASASIVQGAAQQFTATGTFSDSTTAPLTGQVTWASASPALATINPAGLATGVSPGTSAITATLGNVIGSAALTVVPKPPPPQPFPVAGVHLRVPVDETFHGIVAYFIGPDTKTQDFHAQIDWGDKSKVKPGHIHGLGNGHFAVISQHRYIKPGLYTITVTIRDPHGRKATVQSIVHVLKPTSSSPSFARRPPNGPHRAPPLKGR